MTNWQIVLWLDVVTLQQTSEEDRSAKESGKVRVFELEEERRYAWFFCVPSKAFLYQPRLHLLHDSMYGSLYVAQHKQ